MDNPTSPNPAAEVPVAGAPAPAFRGRTPSKASAIRAGVVVGVAIVVAIGMAVAMGAAPRPASTGADPHLAAASGSPAPTKENGGRGGNGFGHGGFGGFFGFGDRGRPDKVMGRGFGHVTITAIDGSSISLATDDGWTRTIQLTATTTITRGGTAATAADLHVGDAIRFRQQKNDDGTFTITAVDIVLPQVLGTIESTADGSFTITDRDGKAITVHLGSATVIRVRGVEKATAKDLAKGQVVFVVGERRSDGSIDATGVLAGKLGELRLDKPKRQRGDGPAASGGPSASGQAG